MAYDILIVDDETDICALTAGILEDEGHQTRVAHNSTEALASVAERRPNLVLLDIWLQGSDLDGLGILTVIKEEHPDVPVVMMSGHGTVETAVSALKLGAYDFIEKPFTSDRMLFVVERAAETALLRRENEELKRRAGHDNELAGHSAAVTGLRQTIEKVAPTNSRVLISGLAGTGKEVVARLLHKSSRRASGPFVVVNCATMNPDRVEEELFGSEEGGTARKVGTFESAHNGTLFLDDVSDMPLETQGKIVRALQEQTFIRVHGSTTVKVDVRVVAATKNDLAKEIAAGKFREDLFYRLNVVPITVPPLSERREDIPDLVRYFMQRTASVIGLPERVFADDAVAILQSYDWPGNARELRNLVERILIMAPGDAAEPIHAESLPVELLGAAPGSLNAERSTEILGLPLREAREIFERDYLLAQLNRFDGNISRTSSFVGMERSALHRKLKTLGVNNEDRLKADG